MIPALAFKAKPYVVESLKAKAHSAFLKSQQQLLDRI